MKKIRYALLLLAFSLVGIASFAQETKELKAVPDGWMPQAGDVALGISATPILRYVGNFFNGNTNNSLTGFGGNPITSLGSYQPTWSLMGKYQLTDNVALRANIGFLGFSTKNNQYVQDDKAATLVNPALAESKVVDVTSTRQSGASFALGVECQKRTRKIQGFAGASLYYAFGKNSTEYAYGNAITSANQAPTSVIAQPAFAPVAYLTGTRALEAYSINNAHAFGVVGHVGVEYFFAPKISIGGELNVSLIHQWQPQNYYVLEGYNTATLKVETYTQTSAPGNSRNDYGTNNLGGNLFISFYF